MRVPLIGASENLSNRQASAERTINLIPMPVESPLARSPWVFEDAPGLVLVSATPSPAPSPPPAPPFDQVINLHGVTNAGSSSAGITLSGLDPTASYALSLPEGQVYTAWSPWGYDANPLAGGLPWSNAVTVTTTGGTTEYGSARQTTASAARTAFPGAVVSGYASYTFWLADDAPGDNRGGLSVRVLRT